MIRNPQIEPRKSLRLFMLTCACLFLGFSQLFAAGGTLKFIIPNDLKVVDPFWTTAYVTRNHGYMIYDTLFALDADLKPQPQMVDK